MKLLDLKAMSGATEVGARRVAVFFGCLAAKDGEGAGRWAGPGFRWFGAPVSGAQWSGPAFLAYLEAEPLRYDGVRAVPADLVRHLEGSGEDLYDGSLNSGEVVYLVDVIRGTRKVTCGVVVDPKGARVLRVFDPEALAAALRRFVEGEA